LEGCMEGPQNGQMVLDPVATYQFSFSGRTDSPDRTVTAYVLKNPDTDDWGTQTNWVPLESTTTSMTPGYWNDPTRPYYDWSMVATPVSKASKSWSQGGLIRLKAESILFNSSTPSNLAVMDEDYVSCVRENSDLTWEGIVIACETRYGMDVATV